MKDINMWAQCMLHDVLSHVGGAIFSRLCLCSHFN